MDLFQYFDDKLIYIARSRVEMQLSLKKQVELDLEWHMLEICTDFKQNKKTIERHHHKPRSGHFLRTIMFWIIMGIQCTLHRISQWFKDKA